MKTNHALDSQWHERTRWNLAVLVLTCAFMCLFATGPAQAENARTFTEWRIPTANSEPLLVLPVSDDTVYFTERVAGKIGKLNLRGNTITEWTLPQTIAGFADAYPHDLIQIGKRIFFCEQRNFFPSTGAIGALNPATGQLTEWQIASTVFPVPEHLLQSGQFVYFTESYSDRIGRLNPNTNALREWALPFGPGVFNLNGLVADEKAGDLWFVEVIANRIARLHVATNSLTEWQLPIVVAGLNHAYVHGQYVYFSDGLGNTIFRLNPATNIIRVWTDPTTAPAKIGGLSIAGSGGEHGEHFFNANKPVRIYFGENAGNNIGAFTTTRAPSADYLVQPISTPITPVDGTSVVVTSTAPKTVTLVVPVTTAVPRVRIGAFTFWPIPTANAGFGEFTSFEDGGLFFTERTGNKVALFTKSETDDD